MSIYESAEANIPSQKSLDIFMFLTKKKRKRNYIWDFVAVDLEESLSSSPPKLQTSRKGYLTFFVLFLNVLGRTQN